MEGGRVRGTTVKKVIFDGSIKGYAHHASREEPQYTIKSDKTGHLAIHKGSAVNLVKTRTAGWQITQLKSKQGVARGLSVPSLAAGFIAAIVLIDAHNREFLRCGCSPNVDIERMAAYP